jgi:hypothetical protein
MPKLKLESLQVESFDTTPTAPMEAGTVHAHGLPTYDPQVCGPNASAECPEPSWETSWCTEETCEPAWP